MVATSLCFKKSAQHWLGHAWGPKNYMPPRRGWEWGGGMNSSKRFWGLFRSFSSVRNPLPSYRARVITQ